MVVIYVALLPNHQFVNLQKVGCLFQYCFNSLEKNTASLVKLFLTLCYTCYLVYLVEAVCMQLQLQASVIVFTHCFVVTYILATLRVQYTILLLHAKQKKIDFKLKKVPGLLLCLKCEQNVKGSFTAAYSEGKYTHSSILPAATGVCA